MDRKSMSNGMRVAEWNKLKSNFTIIQRADTDTDANESLHSLA